MNQAENATWLGAIWWANYRQGEMTIPVHAMKAFCYEKRCYSPFPTSRKPSMPPRPILSAFYTSTFQFPFIFPISSVFLSHFLLFIFLFFVFFSIKYSDISPNTVINPGIYYADEWGHTWHWSSWGTVRRRWKVRISQTSVLLIISSPPGWKTPLSVWLSLSSLCISRWAR